MKTKLLQDFDERVELLISCTGYHPMLHLIQFKPDMLCKTLELDLWGGSNC